MSREDYSALRQLLNSLARPVRASFVLLWVITAVEVFVLLAPAIAGQRWFLSVELRQTLFVLGLLPPAMFLLALRINEGRLLSGRLSRQAAATSILIVLVLCLLPVALLVRYRLPADLYRIVSGAVSSLATACLAFLGTRLVSSHDYSGRFAESIGYVKRVMWDAWAATSTEDVAGLAGIAHVPRTVALVVPSQLPRRRALDNIRNLRAKMYFSREGITAFQESLLGIELEAVHAGELLPPSLQRRGLSVFDIGCAEGRFTSTLVRVLADRGAQEIEISAVDAADFGDDYTKRLKALPAVKRVEFRRATVDVADLPREVDVLLASHSLYSWVDLDEVGWASLPKALTPALLSSVRTGGALIVVLASKDSAAYELRRNVLSAVGITQTDLTSELFQSLAQAPSPWTLSVRRIDSAIKVTDLLGTDSESTLRLRRWLGYFVRYDFADTDETEIAMVRDYVTRRAMRVRTLPASFTGHVGNGALGSDDLILLHKTDVMCFSASPGNLG